MPALKDADCSDCADVFVSRVARRALSRPLGQADHNTIWLDLNQFSMCFTVLTAKVKRVRDAYKYLITAIY